MKNTNTNSVFIFFVILVTVGIAAAIWWGVSDMFAILTHNDWLASLVALIVVLALSTYGVARLRADDVRTAGLTMAMAFGGMILVALMFIATSFYKSSGDISSVGESLAWAIPLAFALPVLIGDSFFIIESLDRWWLTDKKPTLVGAQGRFVDYAYKFQYNIGIIAALAASAVGTYSVMYTVTQSFWHSILYVLSVEAGIYLFSSWTHRTRDRKVFWVSFALTQAMFFLAIIFQFGNAGQNIVGMGVDTNILEQLGTIAISWALIPPLLIGGAFGGLFLYNQTKKPELFLPVKSVTRDDGDRGREEHYVKPERIEREPQPAPQIRVERPQRPQMTAHSGQGKSSHGKQDFAEKGGLPEGLVARLKSIGYSGNEIRKMTLEQARSNASKPKEQLPQPSHNPNSNGVEPKETPENF